jgi:hypothetical protein
MTYLNTSEDLDWLARTHLKAFANLFERQPGGCLPWVAALLVDGTEDAPDHIDLFSEDRHDGPVLRFSRKPNGEGYYLVGVRRG